MQKILNVGRINQHDWKSGMGLKMRLSSAKSLACVSGVRRASGRSFMNSKKRRGPRTVPWGTPEETGA